MQDNSHKSARDAVGSSDPDVVRLNMVSPLLSVACLERSGYGISVGCSEMHSCQCVHSSIRTEQITVSTQNEACLPATIVSRPFSHHVCMMIFSQSTACLSPVNLLHCNNCACPQAMLLMQQNKSTDAVKLLEPLFEGIEPMQESVAIRVCLLLIELYLSCNGFSQAASKPKLQPPAAGVSKSCIACVAATVVTPVI